MPPSYWGFPFTVLIICFYVLMIFLHRTEVIPPPYWWHLSTVLNTFNCNEDIPMPYSRHHSTVLKMSIHCTNNMPLRYWLHHSALLNIVYCTTLIVLHIHYLREFLHLHLFSWVNQNDNRLVHFQILLDSQSGRYIRYSCVSILENGSMNS